ncbi:MAG: hypothetical protein ACSLE1_17255 [Sphingobium sp.]
MMIVEEMGGIAVDAANITSSTCILDPLSADLPDDEVVVTTRRAIGRVAYVAAETGARFQREALPYDPMAWMFAPRTVFDGAPAVEACLDRDDCLRGVLIHGLGLGLDMDRAAIDILMTNDDDFEEHEFNHLYGGRAGGDHIPSRRRSRSKARLRLYTATIAETTNNVMVQAFHASFAGSIDEVRARLAGRFGPDLAAVADIRPGLHPSAPLVIALVPPSTAEVIVRMGRDCSSPAALTFAVDIQQCIQA